MDQILVAVKDTMINVVLVVLAGKIGWDWLKEGRVKVGEYLTISAFENHKKECCAISLKKDFHGFKQEFNDCRASSGRVASAVEMQLKEHVRQLEKGEVNFQLLRKDISDVKSIVDHMSGQLETYIKENEK
jgi:hypothetical protein